MERAQDYTEDALPASGSQEYTSSYGYVSALSRVVSPVVETRMKIKASFRTRHGCAGAGYLAALREHAISNLIL
jgi:predicted alpha/beta superfamily hydrolase